MDDSFETYLFDIMTDYWSDDFFDNSPWMNDEPHEQDLWDNLPEEGDLIDWDEELPFWTTKPLTGLFF